ncbi:MAG: hypothetical protein DRO90_02335 [Candidatus Altiarchaeales archaeon]|nr:MAG: hypothetical protein DRO95_04230 [Candidatus Altiarchaeales archaeon]RLI94263.1 MAG: hypothetical protein DRO90_02335 [Candidatus Altiarchaeales archaeon]
MKTSHIYLLMFCILFIPILSLCVQTETKECVFAKDCEGREHANCSGDWLCIDGKCVWSCGECSLSLCDCKCYLRGETPEEKSGKTCELDCLSKYNISGCKYVSGRCVPVYANRQEEVEGAECNVDDDCGTGGCSNQICGPKEKVKGIITTCEYRPEYECLKLTSCKCIKGKCKWEETEEYEECLEKLKNQTIV